MLVLRKPQISLWDGILPEELRQMPPDLAAVDAYLDDDRFMEPFLKRGQQKVGRPTVPMERYLRLMHLKHSRGLGYETLVAEVNDSITLRRFCRFDVADRLPHPTTLSRLSQRFGDELIRELHEELVRKLHEDRLISGRKARTDTTVVAAEVEYPTDAGLLTDGVRAIGRTVEKLKKVGARLVEGFHNSAGTMKRTMWEIGSFLKRRAAAGGQSETSDDGAEVSPEDAKALTRRQVDALTARAAATASRTLRQVRVLLKRARRRAAHYCKKTRQSVARTCVELKLWADLTQRALDQARLRLAGQTSIPNRMVSLHDPDARPIRRGKLSSPTEFGYKMEVTQVENQIISDYRIHIGNPADVTLADGVVDRHRKLFGHVPEEFATDRGYHSATNERELAAKGVKRVSMPARGKLSEARAAHQRQPWFRRLQRWRAGIEGCISHGKRRFGFKRSRLRRLHGVSAWTGWGVFAHNLTKVPGLVKARVDRAAAKLTRATQKRRHQETLDSLSRSTTRAQLEAYV
jgi:IS5 family transposase